MAIQVQAGPRPITSHEELQLAAAIDSLYHWKRRPGVYPDDPKIVCAIFEEDLDRAIPAVRNALWKDEGVVGRPLRQRELAAALNITDRTFRNHMRDCHIDWDETRFRLK
jgi:hypothetical protein